jgi:hypothetical protein
MTVKIYFVKQSILPTKTQKPAQPERQGRAVATRRIRATAEWLAHFRANAARCRPVPWGLGAEVSPEQLDAITRSLQAWQLGETSDGRHLLAAAARYAARVGDPDYPAVVKLFVREEQRHGELLGQFLDLAGVGRITADWGDALFRAVRYCITDPEVWTTPVVMVETLALIYYNAIRRATGSRVLRTVCAQILADEGPHIRFQCERLANLLRCRSWLGYRLTLLGQRLFYLIVVLLVWAGHRRALQAGGYDWRRYWRAAWTKMRAAWRQMDPRQYHWDS